MLGFCEITFSSKLHAFPIQVEAHDNSSLHLDFESTGDVVEFNTSWLDVDCRGSTLINNITTSLCWTTSLAMADLLPVRPISRGGVV
jgi:hypothetical protein